MANFHNEHSTTPTGPGSCGGLECGGLSRTIWYCVDCACWLCEPCWPIYPPHTGGRRGRDGLEHEKTRYDVYRKLENILTPDLSPSTIEQLHCRDLDSTWFGVRKDNNGRPLFADYDVYSTLMANSSIEAGTRSPQLASFIGQTNAGKSTLIKMLIHLHERDNDVEVAGTSPVVGSQLQAHMPTSSDVHLYADPATQDKRKPLLYADCEGFEGGEKLPIGAIENRTSGLDAETSLSRLTPGRPRQLVWANTEHKKTRTYVVEQLYPRILYTFSDVVVFVLRNAKTFESAVLLPLLKWGAASVEKSINQPTLPHAIIALNSTDIGVHENEWDTRIATQSLLEANKDCLDRLNGNPELKQLADEWRLKGRTINSMLDLIHCYYSTFKVIRIPVKGRYQLLHNQIGTLHALIRKSCDTSFVTKQQARMLSTSDELNTFFQSAFDHFSKTLDAPFDFIEVSLRNNPIPDDFGGHILQLALAVQSYGRRQYGRRRSASWIFDKLRYLIASSVMLDCVRHRKGLPEDLFVEYEKYFHYALEEFCDLHVPCEYQNERDRCVNVASTHHPKGHQNEKGKIIASGHYISKLRVDRYYPIWSNKIKAAITSMQGELQDQLRQSPEISEEKQLLKIHSDRMDKLYEGIGSAKNFLSHSTCFCCLMQAPQHTLPCGHALCVPCIRSYATSNNGAMENKYILKMDHCPLHPAVTRWRSPCIIRFKPDHAGVRLLSLDGGGMRGIVEIEVLRAIEGELGGHIPIREFFDLIVGTSTGGIIALGFGVKNWELKNCSQRFQSLCWEAFSPRKLSNIPGLRHMITLKHAAKYETTPLRNVLEKNFGHGRLFGGNSEEDPNHAAKNHAAKVAVTATDEAGKRAIMLANYSRKDTTQNKRRKGYYDFPRPDDPDLELKIWEAAAATSAAPSFFKPFVHRSTNRTYLDGALYHNNPVRLVHRERKLLWPDVADKHPDIFLSIGTSQNSSEVNKDLPLGPSASQSTRRRARIKELKPEKPTKSAFPKLRQIFKAMHNRMDNILDAEIAWREFCVDVADIDGPSKDAYRYIRINPDIGETPPNLDDVNAMSKLKASTRSALQSSESDSRAQIEKVSHVLVSSCFYYERTALPKSEADKACSCSGRILCRFEDGSPHLRSLGYYLRQQQTKDFGPYFEIENDADSTQVIKLPILPSTITDMIELASFLVDIPDIRLLKRTTEVTISLHLRSSHLSPQGYPISGFPRSIMAEQTVKAAPEDLTPPIRKSSSLGQILKHKPFLSSFENLRSSGIPGRPRASNRSVSEPIPESTPEKARPEISKTTMSMADVGKQKRGSRSLPHDFPAAEVQSERSTGPPSNAYEAPSISQRTRPRSPRQSAISPLSEHASFTSARSRLIIQSSSTNQYSTTSNTGEQHPTSRSGFIVPELEHLAAPVSSSGLGSRYQPGSGTSNGGISREDSYQRKTTIPSRETRAGRPDPKWYTDRGPAADTTRAAQTQHSRKPQTQSDPEEEKVRAQVTSRIEELNSQAEAEAIRKIEAVRYSTNSLDTDRRNDTNQQVSSRPKLSHESRHNSLTAALSPHRRTTPLSHAATQRLNPRHVSSPPYLPSPSPGLRSITSSVSLYSDGQLADINYSSSDSIDNFDDGFEERRRERARRVPSFIWSDAQQSDSTDITSLGRRNL